MARPKRPELKCKLCPKRFPFFSLFKRHLERHSEERPKVCDQCGKGFKNDPDLSQHQKSHSDLNPFGCNLCSKSFRTKQKFQGHEKTMHSGPDFDCECGQALDSLDSLREHRRMFHSGKFICATCGWSFATNDLRCGHQCTATKPYCADCNKYFSSDTYLKHKHAPSTPRTPDQNPNASRRRKKLLRRASTPSAKEPAKSTRQSELESITDHNEHGAGSRDGASSTSGAEELARISEDIDGIQPNEEQMQASGREPLYDDLGVQAGYDQQTLDFGDHMTANNSLDLGCSVPPIQHNAPALTDLSGSVSPSDNEYSAANQLASGFGMVLNSDYPDIWGSPTPLTNNGAVDDSPEHNYIQQQPQVQENPERPVLSTGRSLRFYW